MEALPVLGLALGVGGTLFQGKQDQKQANRESAILEEEAIYQERRAAHDERLLRRDFSVLKGQQEARLAAGGQSLASTTATNLLAETATQEELDALTIRFGGETGAKSARSKAAARRKAGKSSLTSSFFKAGGSLLTGGSALLNKRSKDT